MAEVITGEAVVLEVPCARFPSRLLALGIDLIIEVAILVVLFLVAGLAAAGGGLDPAAAGALGLVILVAVIVGYPVLWETLTRGASPGKFALGLRVVSDDGGPERFRQALVRGLAGVAEIWILLGCPALICSLLSARGKRLGDLFAGTFVVQQRLPARRSGAPLPLVSPELAAWGTGLELSGLTEQTAETARRYLARLPELTPAARDELGQRIAGAVSGQVSPPPPPGTPVAAYLAAVLSERRNREQVRLAGTRAAGAGPAWSAGSGAASSPGSGPAPGPRTGPAPGQGSGTASDPRTGAAPGPGSGTASDPRSGAAPSPGSGAAAEQEEPAQHQPPSRGQGGFAPPA